MSKIKNSGLDQYGAKLFEQQQFEQLALKGLTSHSTRDSPFRRWDSPDNRWHCYSQTHNNQKKKFTTTQNNSKTIKPAMVEKNTQKNTWTKAQK